MNSLTKMNQERVCIKCSEGSKPGDQLDQIGVRWLEDSKAQHPLDTLIVYAEKLNLTASVETLQTNKLSKKATYIHNRCRTELRNGSRRKRPSSCNKQFSNKQLSIRSVQENFDFKTQCFYCEALCVPDVKHPDWNRFEEVRTKGSKIHTSTLEICKLRDDKLAKIIEGQLLSVSDLVAAEAKYHVACRTNFEDLLPKNQSSGCPVSTEKMSVFNNVCQTLEDDIELYTVSEFYNMMCGLGGNTYTLKMTQVKLQEKYGYSLRLASREGKSNIILLDRVGDIISEKWYKERKNDLSVETERIVTTTAKLLKDAIKNYAHEIGTYPAVDDISSGNDCVSHLLQVFINELVKSPVKQLSLSQALFTAARPRSIMPLQFGLVVVVDNRLASK